MTRRGFPLVSSIAVINAANRINVTTQAGADRSRKAE